MHCNKFHFFSSFFLLFIFNIFIFSCLLSIKSILWNVRATKCYVVICWNFKSLQSHNNIVLWFKVYTYTISCNVRATTCLFSRYLLFDFTSEKSKDFLMDECPTNFSKDFFSFPFSSFLRILKINWASLKKYIELKKNQYKASLH